MKAARKQPDYTALLPRLSGNEFAELRLDIEKRGCLVPIEVDEEGRILDGFHRMRACEELGIEPPVLTRPGLTEDEKRAHAIALNLQRRQLDREARKDLHRKLRAVGKSIRQIAEASGTPKSTVAEDVTGVRNRTPERARGRDGKSYPARQSQAPPAKPNPQPQLSTAELLENALRAVRQLAPEVDVGDRPEVWLRHLRSTRQVIDALSAKAEAATGVELTDVELATAEALAERAGIDLRR